MPAESVENFLRHLKKSPSGAVFNPWWQVDKENDIDRNGPSIRRKHLRCYLSERLGKVRFAVIGEALGYRGGHFTGIPMTSERILLGRTKIDCIEPRHILRGMIPRRTSKPRKCPDGFSEPTATIVWSALLRSELPPEEFVFWNAFPWHSFDPRRGMLSNRTPTSSEQAGAIPVLKAFLDLFPCGEVVALGRIAAAQLENLGVSVHHVRHPASGGAKLFRHQIAEIAAPVN